MPNGNHLDTNQALEQLVAGVGVVGILNLLAAYFNGDSRIANPIRECIATIYRNQKECICPSVKTNLFDPTGGGCPVHDPRQNRR